MKDFVFNLTKYVEIHIFRVQSVRENEARNVLGIYIMIKKPNRIRPVYVT